MGEMIDRVARALFAQAIRNMPNHPSYSYDDLAKGTQKCYDEIARSALHALRTPTQAMVHASDFPTLHPQIDIWYAMIDKALK